MASIPSDPSAEDNNEDVLFIEILRHEENQEPPPPKLVEAYVAVVEPKRCKSLLKILARDFPLGVVSTTSSGSSATPTPMDLSHLKRVSRKTTTSNNDNVQSPCKKKKKLQQNENESTTSKESSDQQNQNQDKASVTSSLEVLIRDVASLEGAYGLERRRAILSPPSSSEGSSMLEFLQHHYQLDDETINTIVTRTVPGRPPESNQEWQDFQQQYWPTIFFPQKSKEHQQQLRQLSQQEVQQMVLGMEQAIHDKTDTGVEGAIILDPKTSQVVSRSAEERQQQQQLITPHEQQQTDVTSTSSHHNPLATPILLSIQGVSRKERNKAMATGMKSTDFQKGQYLCTNYDLYTTVEPSVFEAMALVHSRIRRVVFGTSRNSGGIHHMNIHALPSTNHHYRAFQCRPGSDLEKKVGMSMSTNTCDTT